MKYRQKTFAVVMLFLLGVCFTVTAQDDEALTKEEKKRLKQEQKTWKKKLKKMSVEEFYNVMTKHEQLKGQSGSYEMEMGALEADSKGKSEEIQRNEAQMQRLKNNIAQLEKNCESHGEGSNLSEGVVHKVQVGDFNDPTLKAFQEEGKFWEKDEIMNSDTFRKVYTIAYFKDNFRAQAFKKMLRDMGVKDAYVQTYQDGQKSTSE